MGKRTKNWHLLTYDVSCNKRLNKLYRSLLKVGFPVQKSVFLIHTHETGMKTILTNCSNIMELQDNEDELAVFSTDSPSAVWRYGAGADLPVWQLGPKHKNKLSSKHSDSAGIFNKILKVCSWKG